MLYQGDTLVQIPEYPYEIRFQVRNPKSGKLQTYYQYGTEPEFTFFRPVFFRQSVMNTAERNQRFLMLMISQNHTIIGIHGLIMVEIV